MVTFGVITRDVDGGEGKHDVSCPATLWPKFALLTSKYVTNSPVTVNNGVAIPPGLPFASAMANINCVPAQSEPSDDMDIYDVIELTGSMINLPIEIIWVIADET